jgi:DNA-binding MarR family transcriptional regulator
MTPTRVLEIIGSMASKHETTPQRILRGDKSPETVSARHAAIKALAQMPKPTGKCPTRSELARWLNLDKASISRVLA